jgi:hydroxyethylthiazole kinase-like uncharacterized protein yjeF
LARTLINRGVKVKTIILSAEENIKDEDTKLNLKLLQKIHKNTQEENLSINFVEEFTLLESSYYNVDFIIDAIFGTGLRNDIKDSTKQWIEWINSQKQTVISIDLPSGLCSDSGLIRGACVKANLTITIAVKKLGLLFNQGPEYSGKVLIAEIGIPNFILVKAAGEDINSALYISAKEVEELLPKRDSTANKYSVGLALVIVGSEGLTGAATMSASAALKIGAGAVICASGKNIQGILSQKLTEVMTVGLTQTKTDGIQVSSLKELEESIKKSKAALIGCGLGRQNETQEFIREFLKTYKKPVVVDADALVSLEQHIQIIKNHSQGNWILTPHTGELSRLIASDPQLDYNERMRIAKHYAQEWNCILLIKGLPSIIGLPNGKTFINPTGNTALATAGTGDVLAGMCAGLLVQGLNSKEAALIATYLGGLAADKYVKQNNKNHMIALDLLDFI